MNYCIKLHVYNKSGSSANHSVYCTSVTEPVDKNGLGRFTNLAGPPWSNAFNSSKVQKHGRIQCDTELLQPKLIEKQRACERTTHRERHNTKYHYQKVSFIVTLMTLLITDNNKEVLPFVGIKIVTSPHHLFAKVKQLNIYRFRGKQINSLVNRFFSPTPRRWTAKKKNSILKSQC